MIENEKYLPPEAADERSRRHVLEFIAEKYGPREPQLWDVNQTAEYLNLSPRTIYNKVSLNKKYLNGKDLFPVKKVGRKILFPNNLIILWAKNRWMKKFLKGDR